MNKLFTKIVGAALGLTMAIGAGVAVGSNSKETTPVYADSTVSWTASAAANLGSTISTVGGTATGTISTGSFSWNYTRTLISGSDYMGYGSAYGIQLGKNGGVENVVFTTSSITGTITSVSLTCSSYQAKHTVKIEVGDSTYKAATATASGQTPAAITGTGSSSGTITITVAGGTRYVCIKSISVSYSTGTSYKTTVSVTGGAKSTTNTSTAFSSSTKSGDVYLTPSEGYRIPTSGLGSAFTISTGTATISSITDNSDGDVKVSLTGVSSDFTISGAFEAIQKHTVTYSADANGTGSYAHTNQYEGTYTLLDFEDLTGVSANSGYRFKNYTVGGVNKDPGDTFTLSAATPVTVNFEEQPNEATYEPTSTSAASQSGIYPTGATVTFVNTYTSNKEQITGGNSQTWTISGYAGKLIKKNDI